MPRSPVRIVPIPDDPALISAMAQRMAAQRRQRAADLDRDRQADLQPETSILTTAAVIGALNDLTPSDPTPSDFTGAGGDFGGGGASGEF